MSVRNKNIKNFEAANPKRSVDSGQSLMNGVIFTNEL